MQVLFVHGIVFVWNMQCLYISNSYLQATIDEWNFSIYISWWLNKQYDQSEPDE